jgi:hypothetical protein
MIGRIYTQTRARVSLDSIDQNTVRVSREEREGGEASNQKYCNIQNDPFYEQNAIDKFRLN